MKENGKREKENFEGRQHKFENRLDELWDSIGFERLLLAILQIEKDYKVEVYAERLSGKTHLVHIAGKADRIDRFSAHLHVLTKSEPVKWVRVPYEGVFGRWRLRRLRKEKKALPTKG